MVVEAREVTWSRRRTAVLALRRGVRQMTEKIVEDAGLAIVDNPRAQDIFVTDTTGLELLDTVVDHA